MAEDIIWDNMARESFQGIMAKVPVFLQSVAEKKVAQKAESIAQKDNRSEVCQKDVVDAFFLETPFGFHGPLKMDMQALDIDYKKYGHS